MRVHVISKMEFDDLMIRNGIDDNTVEKFDSIMFISIVDTDNLKGPHFKEDHDNAITLRFDDVEHNGEVARVLVDDPDSLLKDHTQNRAFSEAQANRLYKFIKKNREKETCIVHCMAGISRSGAVGTFVNGYCKGDWDLFKRTNAYISPNPRVHRMLTAARYNDLDD